MKKPSAIIFTERDRQVVDMLAQYRFLTAVQVGRLCFPETGARRVRGRLARLVQHGIISRNTLTVQPTPGVPPFFYFPTRKGAEMVGIPFVRLPKLPYISIWHRLMVNDMLLAAGVAAREHKIEFRFWSEEKLLMTDAEVDQGRTAKKGRPFADLISHPDFDEPQPLLPDALMCFDATAERSFFLEADRSTHSLSEWRKRAKLYPAYVDPERDYIEKVWKRLEICGGERSPIKLLIVTIRDFRKRSRRQNILRVIRDTIGDSDLFLAATAEEISEKGFLAPIWCDTAGQAQAPW